MNTVLMPCRIAPPSLFDHDHDEGNSHCENESPSTFNDEMTHLLDQLKINKESEPVPKKSRHVPSIFDFQYVFENMQKTKKEDEDDQESTSSSSSQSKKKRKRGGVGSQVANPYYIIPKESDRSRWSVFTYPLPESLIVIRVENIKDGECVKVNGRLTHTVLGIVDEILNITPTTIKVRGRYIDPENESLKDNTIVRIDELPFKDYGYYKYWYVRNIPSQYSSSNSDVIKDKFMEDLSNPMRSLVVIDVKTAPLASRNKKAKDIEIKEEDDLMCDELNIIKKQWTKRTKKK